MTPNVFVHLHRKLNTWPLVHGALMVSAGLLSACGIPGPQTVEQHFDTMQVDSGMPDVRLHVLRAGEPGGRRVIFVHGTPGSAEAWNDFLADVPGGFEYLAVDRPGFGKTGGPAMVSLAGQAAALARLMADQPVDARPILVGHSLGGPIVAQAAADYPNLVGGIVIVAGSLDPGQERIHPLQPLGEMWPVRGMLPSMIRNSNLELMALKPELEALAARLGTIHAPTIILHGMKDGLVPFENVAFMEARFPPTALVGTEVVPDGNHFLPWNQKGLIDAAIARLADRPE